MGTLKELVTKIAAQDAEVRRAVAARDEWWQARYEKLREGHKAYIQQIDRDYEILSHELDKAHDRIKKLERELEGARLYEGEQPPPKGR